MSARGALLALLLSTTAPAEEAKAVDEVKAPLDASVLDRAIAEHHEGDHRSAVVSLHAWLEAAPATDENRAWAQYFLAKSLASLGLTHAGVVYLNAVVRERANPHAVPRAISELRVLSERPHDFRLVEEQVFQSLDLASLAPEVADTVHFQQGLLDLANGDRRWAELHFARLTEGTPEHSRAQFATKVAKLRDPKADLAALEKDFARLAKDEKLSEDTRREALLAIARLRYERGDWAGALSAYSKVKLPKHDPGLATLYVEEAWTRYRLGQLHEAFGILTTLEAPSFRDELLPEKFLLKAFIYKDLCHFLPAKRAAKEVGRRYADSLEVISERRELTGDPRLRRAALAHGEAKAREAFRSLLVRESERLSALGAALGKPLLTSLAKTYELARGEAERTARASLEASTRLEAARLLRAAEQARLMEYEVGLKLYERVKKSGAAKVAPEPIEVKEGQVGFAFEGEYWNDELRDYRFRLESRCLEETP